MTCSSSFKSKDQIASDNLARYNACILQNQEEAYNLAFLILDDETLAMIAVDIVFRSGYRRFTGRERDFRFSMILQILKFCLSQTGKIKGPEPIRQFLVDLSENQKIVLILVDCLKMNYQEAALLMQMPEYSLRQTLAGARYRVHVLMSNLDDLG